MCIALAPSGAAFGVWQAGQHIGAAITNEPGGLMWEDLRSTDADSALEFYTQVFGYRTERIEEAGPYAIFFRADEEAPLGGIGGMMGAPDGTPSHWLVYLTVPNADAAVEAAMSAGGASPAPRYDTPYGRMAPVTDPWGAAFFVIEPAEGEPGPDRSG